MLNIDFLKKLFPQKKKQDEEDKIFEEEVIDIKDVIAPSSIKIEQNLLRLGNLLSKSYFIFSYPRYLFTGWMSPVINLNIPEDISFFIHPVDSGVIMKRLRRKITEVSAEIMEREEKGLIRDPALESAYRDIEDLRDKLQTAQSKMFRFSAYLTVYATGEQELKQIELTLRSILESRLIYIKSATFRQKDGFNSCCPYGLDLLDSSSPMDTEVLSTFFPFTSFDLSSNEGILYGINRHNNSLVMFDRFSLENSNFVVFAKSGAGKSILGSEPVLIKHRNTVQLTKIGPLIEKLIKKHGVAKIDDELEGVVNPEIEVYSFDKNLKGEWSKVTVAARKKAPEEFYKFTTRSGREVTTTGDHNMLVLKNGKVVAAKSSEIKEGEYIPLPREISENNSSLISLNLLDSLRNSKKVYVKNAENIIQKHYKYLHKASLDKKLDSYLYQYRKGRAIPIQYFWKILDYLKLKSNNPDLQKLKLTSKNGENRALFNIDFDITPSFLKLIGYITAEGTVKENCLMISNNDPEVLKDLASCFKNLGIPFYYVNQGINSACRVFVEIIKSLDGEGNSKNKKVLPFIFNLERNKIKEYLSAYFEGDGGVEKHQITTCSKSRELISEIAYLLYYFGIIGRISQIKKKPSNRNWKRRKVYWKLTISGQENLRRFAENINFISQKKRRRLSEIIKKQNNTNVDVIPEINLIFKEIYQLFGFQLHGIQDISNIKRKHYNPSPEKLKELIKIIEERIQKFKDLAFTFKLLTKLPELATITNLGKNNTKINRVLWQTLKQSWQLIRNKEVKPRSQNVFKMIEVINGGSFSLSEIKKAIYLGFQEMDIPVKYYNKSLQTALVDRPESNTCYEAIQKSSRYIWQNYQNILTNKIPQVEEKLKRLEILANSELFWDPIVKIKKTENKKDKYVYDLTVDNEVFLAGQGGLFVHNSYAIKLELLRLLMTGVEVIVIDPENEYKFLSDAVGGSFFNVSLASPHHVNPFDLPPVREDEKPEDVLRSNVINLVGLIRIMLGGLTPEEDALCDVALTETYAAKDITLESDPKTWPENTPIMSDFESLLEGMEGAETLLKKIQKFTKGTFANFFNTPSNISLENNFVVFGIRDMEESLKPIALYIIMRYIWNSIRATLKKRVMVVDEAWWLMQSEEGASFLFGTCKRARKYWLGVTTITQDVGDFMKSDYGRPIVTNSSLLFLMRQSPATIDIVQKTFNLTENEKVLLLECRVGEGIFIAGDKRVLIQAVASYAEDQFITSSPEEMQKLQKAKKQMAEKDE